MSRPDKRVTPIKSLTRDELKQLEADPHVCNHDRRTFLKWSTLLTSQAIVGGGILNLLTGEVVKADDTTANVANWVYSVCGYCAVGCGLEIGVNSAGKAVFVRGNAAHPTNLGKLCVKGLYEYKILNDSDLRVGARAKYPLLRNQSGGYDQITWDQASTLLAQKIQEAVVSPGGPDSVGIYNTGQWTLEEYYSMGKLGKGAIGTSTMDSNTRLCMAGAVYGYMSTFGSDGPPGCYDDIESTECFFLIGTNPAEMHPQVWRRILIARRAKKPPKLIVVDPRRTATARSADLHLQLKAGTNVALMNGIIQQLITNNWIDSAYINTHTRNYSALANKVATYTPSYVSSITGVPAADIQTAAQWIGTSPEVWSLFIQGVYQSMGATDTVRLICAMHLIMGKIGRPGSAPFSITGQTTAMSNREAGGSSALAGYRNYYNTTHISGLETLWNIPAGRIPGHATIPITSDTTLQPINSMIDMMSKGTLKVFWVACTNPAVTLPDVNKFYQYLSFSNPSRPFVVVQDVYDPMETKQFADLFLPAAMWGEKTGTYTCAERRINLGRQAVDPPGYNLRPDYGAYSDLEIIKMVADKLVALDPVRFGTSGGTSLISYTTPEACFDEWKQASAGCPCDMSGMTYAAIESNNGIPWPATPAVPLGNKRLYTNGLFNTNWANAQYGTSPSAPWIDPDDLSRAYLWAVDYVAPPEVPDGSYPFWLNTGRTIEHFHSRTKTKRVTQLHQMVPEQYVEINPTDATALNVVTGDLVRITSRRGEVIVKARVTDTVKAGDVFMLMHFGDLDPIDVTENNGRLVNANRLTINYVDPVSCQPIYKHCAVQLAKV